MIKLIPSYKLDKGICHFWPLVWNKQLHLAKGLKRETEFSFMQWFEELCGNTFRTTVFLFVLLLLLFLKITRKSFSENQMLHERHKLGQGLHYLFKEGQVCEICVSRLSFSFFPFANFPKPTQLITFRTVERILEEVVWKLVIGFYCF